jgi:hypothetical protein
MAGKKVTVFALVKAKPGMEETVKQELHALVWPTAQNLQQHGIDRVQLIVL